MNTFTLKNFRMKPIAASVLSLSLTLGAVAPSALADTKHAEEHKTPAKEYWANFKQDTEQNWDTTKDAFRDGWIEGKLETAIIMNEHLNPFEIDISVDNNIATLSGDVSSDIDKELAKAVALGIDGIDKVDNQISVVKDLAPKQPEEGRNFAQYMEDLSTTAAVKTALITSSNIDGMDINVDTYRDEVTLKGQVNTEAEKDLAEKIVSNRDGVSKVNNRLQVKS